MMKRKNSLNGNFEKKLLKKGHKTVIGVDEVGMGSLAGPVVVCAVAIKKGVKIISGVRDSKKLSPKQRETLAQLIQKSNLKYKICWSFPKTIDKINIYQAARLAMKRAISLLVNPKLQTLNSKQTINNKLQNIKSLKFNISDLNIVSDLGFRISNFKTVVLVDGPHRIPNVTLPQIPVIRGDSQVYSIACASILAKVYRDKMMRNYAKCYPNYGFEKHKGYGTKLHYAMLANYGPTIIHRKTFALLSSLA